MLYGQICMYLGAYSIQDSTSTSAHVGCNLLRALIFTWYRKKVDRPEIGKLSEESKIEPPA